MKFNLAASLVALALSISATQALAENSGQPTQEQNAPGVPPEILQLLGPHDLAKMSPDQLKAYARQLRRAANMEGLPPDVKAKLQAQSNAVMAAMNAQAQEPQQQGDPGQNGQPPAMKMKPKLQAQDQTDQGQADQGQNGQPPAMKMKPKLQAQDQGQGDQGQQGQGDQPPVAMKMKPKPQAQDQADQGQAGQGQADQPPTAMKMKPKPQAQDQAQADQQQPQAAPPAPQPQAGGDEAALPPPIQRLLAKHDLAQMSDADLMKYQRQLERFSQNPQVPADARMKLSALDQAAQAELAQRQGGQQPQQNAAGQPKAPPPPVPQDQNQQANQQPPKAPVEKPTTAAPAEPPPAPPAPDAQKVQQLDNNPVDPAAEAKAKAYLGDNADLTKLNDDDLRKRLDDTRELLAANQLSQDTERAVRAKLLKERDVLRLRLAQAEAAKQQQAAANPPPTPGQQGQQGQGQQQGQGGGKPPPGAPPPAPLPPVSQLPGQPLPPPPPPPPPSAPKGGLNFNVNINFVSDATPPVMVLQDRRPPEDLQISELQRRIQVYDDAQGDEQYDPSYRDYWRQSLDYDRELLRRRLMWERRHRAMELDSQRQQNQLDIDINIGQPLPPRIPRTVFAAEVDDQDLEDVLTAAPPRRYQPQYSVQDIANNEQLRNDLPRVDIDTIHFGYNEGFVREEELSHLDNIATIIERIVAKYPKEVFLIEGHTDAMGSDAYNLKLSKLRADSVKQMMTTYYNIPAANLRTVGLGERFLKIPTADPEPENRRVSLTRITPLLAQDQ